MLYSRAAFAPNGTGKAVLILTALESLLLKDDREPITQNLADRIAWVVGRDSEERMRVAANVREIYGLRSGYVHHGKQSPGQRAAVVQFLDIASAFFASVLQLTERFDSATEFVQSLDNQKYG